ncbi:tRNA 2-selenouridine(34) synthase MnmH [Pelagibaculum spongiae]|uniref:tRNA 2-selenouridine synthase n=1 Tax=Pelagibaculum spongiae TaxID=2080658 RepID=A0A2V1H0V1_9GAMM|nr:tRNA 2-selenouridine(34) synthase MnmH [Pelagibaculum spongiae]PVZ69642.1 tRNA 2-selenouridine(34) synthase MnmH [Pelagibaculum spongiae]
MNVWLASDYQSLFVNDVPLMDVRAPIEFEKGSFPNATNCMLLDDLQREKIGTEFKQQGQDAAVDLGEQLATSEIRQQRLDSWLAFHQQNPDSLLYCFRGGMRSQITQKWLAEAGVDKMYVEGGYKGMRQYLIEQTAQIVEEKKLYIIGGLTGIGKTELIWQLDNTIDLEGRANHRGSSFGRRVGGQPKIIDFENALAIDMIKKCHQGCSSLVLEDESRLVGGCVIPPVLFDKMCESSVIILQEPVELRLERIYREYVVEFHQECHKAYGEEAEQMFSEGLIQGLARIKKRLGGERFETMNVLLEQALALFDQGVENARSCFYQFIELLLEGYYDPMYHYQLEKKRQRIVFEGDRQQIAEYLADK